MKGYYKMPQQTAEVLSADGWLRTGDQAVEEEDGFIRITGRLKDVIIRGGENIYPKEVEDFLRDIPNIRDVQIVAVPSEKYGEEAAAFVQLHDGTALEAGGNPGFLPRQDRPLQNTQAHLLHGFATR